MGYFLFGMPKQMETFSISFGSCIKMLFDYVEIYSDYYKADSYISGAFFAIYFSILFVVMLSI